MSADQELIERRRKALIYAFGETVMNALADPDVVEVMLNDDGRLWIESRGEMKHVGNIAADDAMAILSQVSSALNGELSKQAPFVEGELVLLNGERFEGVAPPVVERAIFAVRKKATRVFRLADYIRTGVMTFTQAELIRKTLMSRENVLVIGGTGSGKTTFCNAMLAELADLVPDVRMLLLEDTRELQCTLENRVFLRTSPWTTMADISLAVNRLRPDSISVGEVRAGAPALALLKLWNTGHPGGLATAHANSAYEGLTRMDQLIQEVSAHPQRVLIGEAVNVVVFLQKEKGRRQVKEIVRVKGYDENTHKFLIEDIK
ncbi:P-type conjugative transfer ATPase TrbB (plasmid) [Acidovorax carolinensis]|uniref:P-type conjugative transfer ATPase TrbB n=1 Tax=Acidovorax carolinensis TaxID=553814 RepID=A0A240UK65_9BURK|nr:P-type conjugative transfer ATPase TrbB [Acidovorax carolinensis]ART61505.1 P-type conjugative transfer ATPase TrbB [Acidovorax carolinensis]